MAIFGLGVVGRKGLYRSRHSSRFPCGSVSSEASQNSGANNTHLSLLDLHRVRTKKAAQYVRFVVLNRAHEIEFNFVNPYLIVPASPQFMFEHDGKRVPHKDTAKSSQPRTS
jgi:hypothetical protein